MLLNIIYLSVPVIIAGIMQIFVIRFKWLQALAVPVDGGKTYRGKRLFGDNKTVRGFLVYIVVTAGGYALLGFFYEQDIFRNAAPIALTVPKALLMGSLLGLAYAVSELPNSFVKRQMDIGPGKAEGWVLGLVDQVDSIIGCLIVLYFFWQPPFLVIIAILACATVFHLAVNCIFVIAGVKQRVM